MLNNKYDLYLVVPLCIIVLLGIFGMRNMIRMKDAQRETEVKYNCYVIHIALERYAVDNGGLYPSYLLGGDADAWNPESDRACTVMFESKDKLPPTDPLIDGGYLSSYPGNPFIDPGEGRTSVIFWSGGDTTLGHGDPRFGYEGELMGNTLADPLFLWSGPGKLTNHANTIPDTKHNRNNYTAMIEERIPNNPFYGMGGLPQWSRERQGESTNMGSINAFWGGQFFYRAGGPPSIPVDPDKENPTTIWDYKPLYFDRYILGGYGSPRTAGIDCIRLTDHRGYAANNTRGYLEDEFYTILPKYGIQVRLSTPEVFGGGHKGWPGNFPYYDENDEWIYGAPDGYRDGVVILLTSEGILEDYSDAIRD